MIIDKVTLSYRDSHKSVGKRHSKRTSLYCCVVGEQPQVQCCAGRSLFPTVLTLYRTQPSPSQHDGRRPKLYRWPSYRYDDWSLANKRLTLYAESPRGEHSSKTDWLTTGRHFGRNCTNKRYRASAWLCLRTRPWVTSRFREAKCKAAGLRQTQARQGNPQNR